MKPRYYQTEAADSLIESVVPSVAVIPPGGGKSLVIALAAKKLMTLAPHFNMMMVQPRKELIEQNYAKFQKLAPEFLLHTGIYSASLGLKELKQITFAGIHSIYDKDVPLINGLFIDECDLIPPEDEGMYRTLIAKLLQRNPNMGIFGLTATPFRLKTGMIVEGETAIFKDICYDIGIKELIHQGFLSKLVTKFGMVQPNLNKVHSRGQEYVLSDLENAVSPIVQAACDEIASYKDIRSRWLIFTSGVEQAKQFARELTNRGCPTESIDGSMSMAQREALLAGYVRGDHHLANCEILTVGIDLPETDLIAVARPTKSARLFMQICGRGFRVAPNKKDCLILDYGRNIERFGSIDCLKVKKIKGQYSIVIMPMKKCPQCGEALDIGVRICICGYIFERSTLTHEPEASELPILSEEAWHEVEHISYKVHRKDNKPPSLKITYHIYKDFANEFLCFQHGGFPQKKAYRTWHKMSGGGTVPLTAEEAYTRTDELKKPGRVLLQKANGYFEVLDYDFSVPMVLEKPTGLEINI